MTDHSWRLPDHIIEASHAIGRNIPRLRSAEMLLGDPDIPFCLRGILPRQGVAAIYGPPTSGKTFVALDLIFSLASGRKLWFLIPAKPTPAVYVALEGQAGIKRRIDAWQRHNRTELGESVQVWSESFRLDDPNDVDTLAREAIAQHGKGCVIVIDTLAQAMAGFDENSSAEMGAAIAGAQHLSSFIEGLVILIHHAGKDVSKGMRGHSSLLGALDASIEVVSKANGRTWRVRKSKDGEAGQEFAFELVYCDLGSDVDGEPIGSCAVRQTALSPSSSLPPVRGKHRIPVMARLRSLTANGMGSIDFASAVNAIAPDIDVVSSRQRTVTKDTINALIVSGHLQREGDTLCIPS